MDHTLQGAGHHTGTAEAGDFPQHLLDPRVLFAYQTSTQCPVLRLRGAGGDGGSTGAESRSSYLEMYKEKKEDKVDPSQLRHARWTQCAYSGKPLRPPLVSDAVGSIFNKSDLLEGLAAKSAGAPWPESLAHIRLKDLIPISPRLNAAYAGDAAVAGEETGVRPGAEAPLECPLTGAPLNGRARTLLHKPTGLLFSESGLRKATGVARELILEAANGLLESADAAAAGEEGKRKGGKKGAAAAAARAVLADIARKGGKWEEEEMLVVNPEGEDAEKAKAKLHAIQAKGKGKAKAGVVGEEGAPATKRGVAGPAAPGARKRPKSVVESLFHSDADAAPSGQETYCCRSVSARGFVS